MDPVEKKKIQYPYAFDEDNNLVYIEDIDKDHRHDHTYHCPDCGHPMLPRLGEKNAKHFYHSDNHSCNKESYIHSVAKRILANRFNDRTQPFKIKLWNSFFCKEQDSCKWFDQQFCEYCRMDEYNLHEKYDLPAREEVWLKNGPQEVFRPDVVLESSSSKHKPIYLEVYHKHKCSDKKLQSGNHIIEIRVKDFTELVSLQTLALEQSERVNFQNFKDIKMGPVWFQKNAKGIARDNDLPLDSVLPVCFRSREGQREFQDLWRVILYSSGKTYSSGVFEDELDKHKPFAIADITFDKTKMPNTFHPITFLISHLPKHLLRCQLCCHYVKNMDETNYWCELRKNGSLRNGTFDAEKGRNCSSFEWNMVSYPVDPQLYSIWINRKLL